MVDSRCGRRILEVHPHQIFARRNECESESSPGVGADRHVRDLFVAAGGIVHRYQFNFLFVGGSAIWLQQDTPNLRIRSRPGPDLRTLGRVCQSHRPRRGRMMVFTRQGRARQGESFRRRDRHSVRAGRKVAEVVASIRPGGRLPRYEVTDHSDVGGRDAAVIPLAEGDEVGTPAAEHVRICARRAGGLRPPSERQGRLPPRTPVSCRCTCSS